MQTGVSPVRIGVVGFVLLACGFAAGGAPIEQRHHLEYHMDDSPRSETTLRNRLEAMAHAPGDCNLMLQLALDYLSLADTDHWEYLDRARDYLKKILKDHPGDPLVTMYLGRAIGAKALNLSPSTLRRLQWAREGFRLMDAAVDRAPEDPYLRLLRAESQLMAHPILRRKRTLERDAEMLASFMRSPDLTEQPTQLGARLHLFFGDYLEKQEDGPGARDHWASAARLAPGTPLERDARARLEGSWQNLGYEGD